MRFIEGFLCPSLGPFIFTQNHCYANSLIAYLYANDTIWIRTLSSVKDTQMGVCESRENEHVSIRHWAVDDRIPVLLFYINVLSVVIVFFLCELPKVTIMAHRNQHKGQDNHLSYNNNTACILKNKWFQSHLNCAILKSAVGNYNGCLTQHDLLLYLNSQVTPSLTGKTILKTAICKFRINHFHYQRNPWSLLLFSYTTWMFSSVDGAFIQHRCFCFSFLKETCCADFQAHYFILGLLLE